MKTYLDITPIFKDGTFEKHKKDHLHFPLSADPTCIELLEVGGCAHVLVGTLDSKVTLFRITQEHEVSTVLEVSLNVNNMQRSRSLCESAVVLTSSEGGQVLVCATRNGLLLSRCILGIKSDEPGSFLEDEMITDSPISSKASEWSTLRMGSTSAEIYGCSTDDSTAFVSCGPDFCRIRCLSAQPPGLNVESIWFTNRTNPGYLQNPVTAAYQLPYIKTSSGTLERNLGGFLLVVSGDQMLYTQLDADFERGKHNLRPNTRNESKVLPRNLITSAKPTIVSYLSLPRKMLVATTETSEGCAPPDGYRILHSTLSLLNVHDDKPLNEISVEQGMEADLAKRLVVAQYVLNHAERVYSIVDWPFEDHRGKKYNLVIVGTGVRTGTGKEVGRRLIFNLGQRGSKLSLQKESNYPNPLYCIALFSNRATVSVCGKLLSFDEFDAELGRQVISLSCLGFSSDRFRWFNRASRELPSCGIHVTVSGSQVYVSTLQHSHLCYDITRDPEDSTISIEQLFTDSRERSCTHHLTFHSNDLQEGSKFEQESLVLITDKKSATISGLYHSGEPTFRNSATTLFEASLPRTVIRLQRGDIRPPWRRPSRFTKRSDKTEGILADDIIGACSDGTIYAFSVLSEPARHVLRLLQNLIETEQAQSSANRFSIIRHRSGDIFDVLMNGADGAQATTVRARDVDPRHKERGPSAPRNNHIDGDLLSRFFESGGDIRKLLSVGVEQDVPALFMELGARLLSQESYHFRNGSANLKDILIGMKGWLEEVLAPML